MRRASNTDQFKGFLDADYAPNHDQIPAYNAFRKNVCVFATVAPYVL